MRLWLPVALVLTLGAAGVALRGDRLFARGLLRLVPADVPPAAQPVALPAAWRALDVGAEAQAARRAQLASLAAQDVLGRIHPIGADQIVRVEVGPGWGALQPASRERVARVVLERFWPAATYAILLQPGGAGRVGTFEPRGGWVAE